MYLHKYNHFYNLIQVIYPAVHTKLTNTKIFRYCNNKMYNNY